MHDTYFLVAIIDNDYVDSILFDIFDEIIAADQELRREDAAGLLEGVAKTADTDTAAGTETPTGWF